MLITSSRRPAVARTGFVIRALTLASVVGALALASMPAAGARGFGGSGGFHSNFGTNRAATYRTPARTMPFVARGRITKSTGMRVSRTGNSDGYGEGGRRPPHRHPHPHRPPVVVGLPGGDAGPPVGVVNLPPSGTGGPPPNIGGGSGGGAGSVPAANERRYVPDEVLVSFATNIQQRAVVTFAQSQRLALLGTHRLPLINTVLYRFRITDRRLVPAVISSIQTDGRIAAVQPNYLYALQAEPAQDAPSGESFQYVLAKLHVPEAHALATGSEVPVAVIDSAIDVGHPELQGLIAAQFDAGAGPAAPHRHGTAMAGAIAAHARLVGLAPAARILAVRAFDTSAVGATGTTSRILDGIQWAVDAGARVVNMSFAGPSDRKMHEIIAAARRKGVVLVAAAGNDGPQAPPAYPGAYPEVIAVTATDADDKVFRGANRGSYIAVAAPGVDIFVAAPNAAYDYSTGTSVATAHVSGLAALLIERNPRLTPDALKAILLRTAKHLAGSGRDDESGAGLVDAYEAVLTQAPATAEQVH